MNAIFSQDDRLGKLSTALGKDKLVLLRFSGTDYVNDLFEYHVEALSTEGNIAFDDLIGTSAGLEFLTHGGGTRHFSGIVTSARWLGPGENGHRYDLTLRPWLWLASKRRHNRIFNEKSVRDILTQVLNEQPAGGNPNFTDKLTGSYDVLEYTVQYGESDLDFVSRLMERFGISYHFEHDDRGHTMVLTDAVESFPELPGTTREYIGQAGQHNEEVEHFWDWHPERNLTVGGIRSKDYNFKTPTAQMETEKMGDAAYANGQIESYDYPGVYLDEGEGKQLMNLRTAQERFQDNRHTAEGDVTSLGAGMRFILKGEQPPGVKEQEYVCLQATHSYVSDGYGSGGGGGSDHAFSGSYVMTPSAAPIAPVRKTVQPTIQGVHVGVVAGSGEVDCDEYGRILVVLPWALDGAKTMRCRVSQNWAMNGWGGMIIPRVGMEVIVEYLHGDPNLPIVTGCVYNGREMPKYPLPANKSRSWFVTDSHEGDGFNELRFEDQSGEEEIFWHAQKDLNTKVLNNTTMRTDMTYLRSVGHNKVSETRLLDDHTVGGMMKVTVTGGQNEVHTTGDKGNWEGIGRSGTRAHDMTMEDVGSYWLDVAKDIVTTIGQDVRTTVGRHEETQIAKNLSEVVGENVDLKVGEDQTLTVGQNLTEDVGRNWLIEAGDSITIKVGAASIVMKKDGSIQIKGTKIAVKGNKIDLN